MDLQNIPTRELTSQNYQCPDNERDFYHVKFTEDDFIEKGVDYARFIVQKFDPLSWELALPHYENANMAFDVLFNPETHKVLQDQVKADAAAKKPKE